MKTIQKEIVSDNILFGTCLMLLVCMNLLVSVWFMRRYSSYMDNYRKIHQIESVFNDSRTYFHLYNKEREAAALSRYEEGLRDFEALLTDIGETVSGDRQSQMMLRIVSQMMDHRKEVIADYVSPGTGNPDHGIDYIEELDLLLENNLNLLTTSCLDFFTETYERAVKDHRRSLIAINLSLLFIGIGIMILNDLLLGRVLNSFRRLRDAAAEIGQGNFEGPDVPANEYEEINVVARTFNEMKQTIREMIAEINRNFEVKERLSEQMLENERHQRRLAESKMKELQMQINPHFLFNTLSLVIRSIQLGENETAVMLIKDTSRILRSSIETHALAIPLDEEIELLESYLNIQRVHCRGRISLQLDVRKSYMGEEVQVPPLIIQPLVENAILHGLKNVTENGQVSISITERAEYIETKVTDNGCGLKKQTIEDLKNHKATRSIGLLNVMERLQLLYRREEVMRIRTGEDGTEITILFFKRAGENTASAADLPDGEGEEKNDPYHDRG